MGLICLASQGVTGPLKETCIKIFDTGRFRKKNWKCFLLTAHKHPSQSLRYKIILKIKVELDGHILRKMNFGCMEVKVYDTCLDFAVNSADFKGEELSLCWDQGCTCSGN